jgi:hypothetical protein
VISDLYKTVQNIWDLGVYVGVVNPRANRLHYTNIKQESITNLSPQTYVGALRLQSWLIGRSLVRRSQSPSTAQLFIVTTMTSQYGSQTQVSPTGLLVVGVPQEE